jgi:raffinose/stachyose/melibiose transport system substrate-binding protein
MLGDEGYFNKGANALQHSLARSSFIAGRAGMMYIELEEFVTVADGMGADAFGFFQFPSGTGGAGDQNLLTGAPDGFMVSAESKHPEEALMFLRFLLSPEMGAEYVRRLGIPSAVVGAVNDDTALPIVVEGVQAINEASGMALWLDTDINIKIVEVYLPGMQALLNGTETPESVMQKVHEAAVEVQAELAAQ